MAPIPQTKTDARRRLVSLAKYPTQEMPTEVTREEDGSAARNSRWFLRNTYSGSILFNNFTFFLPALYGTLSKLWIAQIDSSSVATTDAYTYLGVVTEVLNEGLPRASYLVIGDLHALFQNRLGLLGTLLLFQLTGGLLLSLTFLICAPFLASTFVPQQAVNTHDTLSDSLGTSNPTAVKYIRISSFSTFFTVAEYALGSSLRSLDRPDVPLVISLTKVVLNIILDIIFLSKWRIYSSPTVNTQAVVRLVCDALGAIAGLVYLLVTLRARNELITGQKYFRFQYLKRLAQPGLFTFIESALRNLFYLIFVAGIVTLGQEYATAWGVFNTIRWGVVMVPTNAFTEATAAFTGHEWNSYKRNSAVPAGSRRSWRGLLPVLKYSFISSAAVFAIEVILAVAFSLWWAEDMAYYLSGDTEVAKLTATMWRTMDWTYVLFAVSLQLSAVLLSTWPFWYLVNSLLANLLWVLPWAIAIQTINITEENAWSYHSVIFGGSLVIGFVFTVVNLIFWGYAIVNHERWSRFRFARPYITS